LAQLYRRGWLARDEGAVLGAQVFEHVPASYPANPRVFSADAFFGEVQVGTRATANRELLCA
jgi:hypothetical protein